MTTATDYLASVAGQPRAVEQLLAAAKNPVHAYLFVGPAGCGKSRAAQAFAAAVLNDERALRGTHPDVVTVEREGAFISIVQAREISRLSLRSPVEGERKVLILPDFHLVADAAPALLKTIEEASASTIFLILAESIPQPLVTVASRCVRIDFAPLSDSVVEEALIAEGVEATHARSAASNAFGNLERARLLAHDEGLAIRRDLWSGILARLDGTGFTVTRISDEIIAAIDSALEPLTEQQAEEKQRIAALAKETGQSGPSAKDLETRHKREQRRLRTDEVRYGLAILAREVSPRVQAASGPLAVTDAERAMEALQSASEALTYNANEALLLQGLLVRLSQLSR